jgi:hypothetical protein
MKHKYTYDYGFTLCPRIRRQMAKPVVWFACGGYQSQVASRYLYFILKKRSYRNTKKLRLCEPVRKQYQCSEEQYYYSYNGAFFS